MSVSSHPSSSSSAASKPVVYPDSDGMPMADNTEQFEFIQMVQGNLDAVREDFVAGDHLWYPVEGRPEVRVAPDVYVAVGRPKGHRGSYKQWEEDNTPLTVVFEWWSPNARFADLLAKYQFYDAHGVTEFFSFHQVTRELSAFRRIDGSLEPVPTEGGVTSEVLGIRMEAVDGQFRAWRPDGSPFLSMTELDQARLQAIAERDAALTKAAALAEKLRALGVDPDAL